MDQMIIFRRMKKKVEQNKSVFRFQMELSKAPPPPCSHRYGRKEGDMEAMLMSSPFSSKSLNPIATINPNKTLRPIRLDLQLPINSKPSKPPSSTPIFAVNPATATNGRREDNPLVVVGSANADIYVEIERLPREGGTVSAKTGETLAGGKGANQAACGAKLEHPTFFIGQLGSDAHGGLIAGALADGGVRLDRVRSNEGAPTGHAVVMLQEDGQNSIIIVGGANMNCWPEEIGGEDLELIRTAGVVLLQREIPDRVNVQVAKAAKAANVPVILDAGGMDGPFPAELLKNIDILSPNESELARLTGFPTDSFEQISQAVSKCHEMGVKQVLVKLGAKGSALFIEGKEPIRQPIVPAEKVLDTTGAGDTFTAAFAVALVEGKPLKDCMQFAAAAASLCVQVKGAIPSIPDRKAVLNLVQSLQ